MMDRNELAALAEQRRADKHLCERLERNAGWRNERWQCVTDPALLNESAQRILALIDENARLREALEPFANPPPACTGEAPMTRDELRLGSRVRKLKGYPWPGVVVADFTNLAGQRRLVVECTVPEVAGALHIYNPEQLEPVTTGEPE